ncbi:MAG: Na+/H+ antiporter subunit G [Kangiellaceae bacterium]|nr:Na+/H+ antiporter subunit G [Kangiellaceae bacterium]
MWINTFTVICTLAGAFFFMAGTLGLLRFPDVYCRLHALTKADNLGLGLIAVGLVPQAASTFDAIQLVMIWLFAMIAGAVAGYMVANYRIKHCCAQPAACDKHCGTGVNE